MQATGYAYAVRMQARSRSLEHLTHAMRMLYAYADVCYTYAGALRAEASRAPDACYAYAVRVLTYAIRMQARIYADGCYAYAGSYVC